MPLLDLTKITLGLSKTWAGYLRDWDRTLRSANHAETTRDNLLAAAQLIGDAVFHAFLDGRCEPPRRPVA
ncbi:hypothetical protein [Amycolatopsis taiwanensis]|uniref:hypothetical protein n=1 Tax=Amycolatopsis taiwanensis TaxID=342230 RepID=UPI00048A35F1|nr:hypothetical protein [Amycolatopsis taiwanensis]